MTPLEYLFSLELHGVKLGLDNITRILRTAGNPERSYPTVHIGGSNGKGSSLSILDATLRAAGYTVGRFTSPHLITIRERFQINGETISSPDLEENIRYFKAIADTLDPPPTFFEINTAIAFRYFAQRAVDLALIEVGLGGRFDSTNVLQPAAVGITNIELEHTRYLGNTYEAIAFEKAGIIKHGIPTVVAELKPGPLEVILERARTLDSPVRLLGRDFHFELTGPSFDQVFTYTSPGLSIGPTPLALCGAYQGPNAALAITLAVLLQEKFPEVNTESMLHALRTVKWPCRLERVLERPPVIIDVAHNAAGVRELVKALPNPCVIILAVASDKDASAMIRTLGPIARPLILTQFEGSRALPVDALCQAAGDIEHRSAKNLDEALAQGLELASEKTPLIVAGSLYTAGHARRLLIEEHGAPPLEF